MTYGFESLNQHMRLIIETFFMTGKIQRGEGLSMCRRPGLGDNEHLDTALQRASHFGVDQGLRPIH